MFKIEKNRNLDKHKQAKSAGKPCAFIRFY